YNEIIDFHQMPYNLYWFNDGIYVQGVHKNYKEALGAKVITIGSMPVEKAINAIKPVVSSENDQFFKGVGLNYLGVPEVMHAKRIIRDISKVTMTLEKNGKQFNITFVPRQSNSFPGNYGLIQSQGQWLDARPVSSTPLWLKHFDKRYYFEYLSKEKTVYVRQSSVIHDEERIEDFYSRVFDFIDNNEVEKLIIDLRLNGGGDNFNNKSVILGLIKSEKINQKGRLFVVIGRRTFSAAQNLVNEIENYTEATFVGEPTAENVNFYGDSRTETLPNSKLSIRLSWAWWQDKDPRDTRKWTAPQVAVELSFKDYVDNTDPIISAIELSSEIELTLSGLTLSRNTKEFKNKIKFYS
ncbi:MAG: S41 family peptidase, partial [Balneola sp.]